MASADVITFKTLENNLYNDLVNKIANNVHQLRVHDMHVEMAMETTFFKKRTPLEGLRALYPNIMIYYHKIDDDQDMFDSFCCMDRVLIFRLTDTDLLVLSEFKDEMYHAASYKIFPEEKKVRLIKDMVYRRTFTYKPEDCDNEIDFIRESLDLEDYSFETKKTGENKWLLGSAMINWFIAAGDKEIGI